MPTKVRRNGPYAPLSAHYARDDAILTLDADEDDLAELLFVRALAYCAGDPRLDGFISDTALRAGVVVRRRRQQRVTDAAQRLADLGVWAREATGYRIRSWEKWNRTASEIETKRAVDRSRKGGRGPDDDPPPPSDADAPPDDDPFGPSDHDAGSRNGFRAESPRIPVHANNATQDNATQTHPTNTAAAAHSATNTPPPPDLPAELQPLADELARRGITVSWHLHPDDHQVILDALDRCGLARLVKHAQARYRPDDPAFSVRAFLAGWATLTAPRPVEPASRIPCHHGAEDTRYCGLCRTEKRAAG